MGRFKRNEGRGTPSRHIAATHKRHVAIQMNNLSHWRYLHSQNCGMVLISDQNTIQWLLQACS